MSKNTSRYIGALLLAVTVSLGGISSAMAYSCKAVFQEAQQLIKKAESLVTPKTDSRIKAMIAEAKGLAEAGLVSHTAANERHVGSTGKYAHGDAVRKGRWAVSLAKEALFLLTGDPR